MDQFLAPETDTKRQFLEPETDVKCQFLLLGPETDLLCQFLEPETDIMGERNYKTKKGHNLVCWHQKNYPYHTEFVSWHVDFFSFFNFF